MTLNIWNVLAKLEDRSKLERSEKVVVSREEMMLAISMDGVFLNFLKAMKAKGLETEVHRFS